MNVLASFQSDHLTARGISDDRQRAQLRVIQLFLAGLAPSGLSAADGDALVTFMTRRAAAGAGGNTIRKERAMLLSFFSWAYARRLISAEAQLSLRATPTPISSCATSRPRPYTRSDLKRLSARLDVRWPRLEQHEVDDALARWRRGTGRYCRFRAHAIRLQLEAIIALTLYCGLRRAELAGSTADDVHPDNAYVVARKSDGSVRAVPFPDVARTAVGEWLDLRELLAPDHNGPWLSLWAEPTCRRAMSEDSLSRVLSTYIGEGWSLSRLRQTCGISWLRAGLSIWHVQRLLGHQSIRDTLPYAEAMKGDTLRAVAGVQGGFGADLIARQRAV